MSTPQKILVVYNTVETPQGEDKNILADEDNLNTALDVGEALKTFEIDYELFDVNEKNIDEIKKKSFDLVFNLAEGLGSIPRSDFMVAAFFEKNKIPFTGSSSQTLALTNNKMNTKSLLLKNGLQTPRFAFLDSNTDPVPEWLRFPLIVKPVGMDCSIGIDQNSVVENEDDLRKILLEKEEKYQDLFFLEEYIDGREINIALLGNGENAKVLPPSEITFSNGYNGKYKIVDYDAKWVEFSNSYKHTPPVCPAEVAPEILKELNASALKAYEFTFCHDYGRVDFRLDKDGVPYILEVNANQGISKDTGTSRSAVAAGYSYESFIKKIVDISWSRYGN